MKDLPVKVGQMLRHHTLRLAVAESCTGGLIGSLVTDVPGSSDYFVGGVIAYSNEIKNSLLSVPVETLERFGAVSQETVRQMAQNVRDEFKTEIGLSVSGIAGPDGGTPEKPVGTVWIGLAGANLVDARLFHFDGDRRQNKKSAARAALQFLLDYLEGRLDR